MSMNITLGVERTAMRQLWYDAEVHLRAMLRWALRAEIDVRSSLLYLLGNCPTVQLLVLKRCLRYFRKLEGSQRFVHQFIDAVRTNIDDTLLGTSVISFWPEL